MISVATLRGMRDEFEKIANLALGYGDQSVPKAEGGLKSISVSTGTAVPSSGDKPALLKKRLPLLAAANKNRGTPGNLKLPGSPDALPTSVPIPQGSQISMAG